MRHCIGRRVPRTMIDALEDLVEAHLALVLVPHCCAAAWFARWWDACTVTV